MADSLTEFLLPYFIAHRNERAYGERRGYRMEWSTYQQTLDGAFRFAHELEKRKIGKGDRVMIWGGNSAKWVSTFWGCAIRGTVAVPMDDSSSLDFAFRVFQQVQARLLICSRKHAAEIAARSGDRTPALVLEELPELLKANPAGEVTPVAINSKDALQIVFTSGTTADPKGVVITHGNVLANVAPLEIQIRSYLKYERWVHPVRFLSLLPLSHVFGQFLGMFLPPLMGGAAIFQEEVKPSEIVETIQRERISVLVTVPRILQSLKQKIERDLTDQNQLNSFQRSFAAATGKHFLLRWWTFRKIHRQLGWKFWAFISGGASLDGETEEFWGRLGYAVIQGYGLTETTSLISVNHPFRLGKGSIGKVLPGREVKLAPDGEILVRGGSVASGYWERGAQAASQATDDAGWYRTGDLGALDEAGNLFFRGRKKDVIVTPAGLNIFPEDLEAALRAQPEVRDCVVVGIERGGNAEPCAVLISRDGQQLGTAVQRANQSLEEYQRVPHWLMWPEKDFPRTSTHKPRKQIVQAFAQKQIAAPTAPSGPATGELAGLIGNITRRATEIKADSNLDTDLGLSSLDRVELLNALEERYQLDLGETYFSAARTVGDLENILRGKETERVLYHYPRWTLSSPVRWIRIAAHYLLVRPAMALLGWPRIEGRENLAGWRSPLLVVSNHIDDVDVGFIQAALPARYRHWLATATGGEALEVLRSTKPGRGVFGRVFDRAQWTLGAALLNLFPLPREAGFRKSFAYAGEAVDRGYSILVFPEGHHTLDGKLRPFREGIGLLASNLGIPVLPMRIIGLFDVKQAGKKFALPGRIRVRIGRPIKFPPNVPNAQIAAELQKAVDAL